jgi:hypothetical protein
MKLAACMYWGNESTKKVNMRRIVVWRRGNQMNRRISEMYTTSLGKAVLIMLFATGLGVVIVPTYVFARRESAIIVHRPITPHFAVPPLVRFTGTLVPPNKKDENGLHTLRVLIQDQEWLFRLDNVETLTGTNYGWMILNDIFPPELHFTGSDDLIRTLQAADRTDSPVRVEGRLYISDRMFAVTAVEESAQKTD